MAQFKIGEVADLLGVSNATVRGWTNRKDPARRLATTRTKSGHRLIDGKKLAEFLTRQEHPDLFPETTAALSARNRFYGLVTKVVADKVAAQVEIQSGRHRIVALTTREAVEEMCLEPGVLAAAAIKSTNVIVERPELD